MDSHSYSLLWSVFFFDHLAYSFFMVMDSLFRYVSETTIDDLRGPVFSVCLVTARLWDLTSSLYGNALDADIVGFLGRALAELAAMGAYYGCFFVGNNHN
jgi:hypothetical protein